MNDGLAVRFWGVRGSVPCPGAAYVRYGGNTSCVSVEAGGHTVVFDAGTGLRLLGQYLQQHKRQRADILLSHTHFDHISGLPFFAPAYDKNFSFTLQAGHLEQPLESVLRTVMNAPFFPISPSTFRAKMTCRDFIPGAILPIGEAIQVHTVALNHPDRATGYRLNYQGRSVCYITDTEHTATPDAGILALIAGADLVIYDSMFSGGDYDAHQGWGHSSVEEAVRLCQQAGAKRLALFHHNPDYDDERLAAIERDVQSVFPAAFAAREGQTVLL